MDVTEVLQSGQESEGFLNVPATNDKNNYGVYSS